MEATVTRKSKNNSPQSENEWPRKVAFNGETVTVYRRKTPVGNWAYMVSNSAGEKRRFDCYADEAKAIEAAEKLAERMAKRHHLAAGMTQAQAIEYANSIQALQALHPLEVTLNAAVSKLVEAVKIVGDLSNVTEACKFFVARRQRTTAKPVADVVTELLNVKEGRGASERYMQDLRYRLTRFSQDCQKDASAVTTPEIQAWLDGQKLKPQAYTNFRRVLHLLFKFAVARGYAAENPVEHVERVKVRNGDIEIFSPAEISRLLTAASPDFLPCLAIGAFAGLRSAEIERLEWSDIDLAGRHIVVGASRAKTASRRIVPLHDNLAVWLAPYASRKGKVWSGSHDEFYDAQQETAAATATQSDPDKGIAAKDPVKWKSNGLRHSYASYRFAQIGDAGRVAGELGNSAAVVHRHYRELVKPADAERWFGVTPEAPANILPMAVAR